MPSWDIATDRQQIRGDLVPDDRYFERFREPFGGEALTFRIGPLETCLEGMSEAQAANLLQRCRPFVFEGIARPDVRIGLSRAGVEHFLKARCDGSPETYRLESRRTGGRLRVWSYEFAGWVDAEHGCAELALVEEQGELFERGLENFLRALTASFILDRGGLLLHASGVIRRGMAHLFFGPSGRGKTTVTALSPEDIILSDDLSLVVRNNGRFEAVGIPFGMAHHHVPDTRDSFPIASLNGLVQSREVRRQPLTGAQAVADIVTCLPFVIQETGQSAQALEVIGRMIESVPAYRLWFRKDPSFWTVIDRRDP